MLERLREQIAQRAKGPAVPIERVASPPVYWEQQVSNSYRALRFEISQMGKAKFDDTFSLEHIRKVKNRVGNLKDVICNREGEMPIVKKVPEYVLVKSDEEDYFYYPAANALGYAIYRTAKKPLRGERLIAEPNLLNQINETVWCKDQTLVADIGKALVGLLPYPQAERILAQAS